MEIQRSLRRELEIFYEITRAINASLSRQDVLSEMLHRIVTDLGYKAASLWLLDQEQQMLELKGRCRRLVPLPVSGIKPFPVSRSALRAI
jgi:nitrate/nitrite-specific signal transduction histidine kinase